MFPYKVDSAERVSTRSSNGRSHGHCCRQEPILHKYPVVLYRFRHHHGNGNPWWSPRTNDRSYRYKLDLSKSRQCYHPSYCCRRVVQLGKRTIAPIVEILWNRCVSNCWLFPNLAPESGINSSHWLEKLTFCDISLLFLSNHGIETNWLILLLSIHNGYCKNLYRRWKWRL